MVTVCQEGFGNPAVQVPLPLTVAQLLGPPPVDEMPMSACAVAAEVIGTQPTCAGFPPCVQKRFVEFAMQNSAISASSFQPCSGIYERAVSPSVAFVVPQYVPVKFDNGMAVPPTLVTS